MVIVIGNTDVVVSKSIDGARFSLGLNQSQSLFFKMGCGPSTNTRDELLTLWDLLVSIVSMGLHSLSVQGDFSMIINWTNSKATLSTLHLDY